MINTILNVLGIACLALAAVAVCYGIGYAKGYANAMYDATEVVADAFDEMPCGCALCDDEFNDEAEESVTADPAPDEPPEIIMVTPQRYLH